MSGTGLYVTGDVVNLSNNLVSDCGQGIFANGVYRPSLFGNSITRCRGIGIRLSGMDTLRAERNVVAGCDGSAVTIESSFRASLQLIGNTLSSNSGTGIELLAPTAMENTLTVSNNIAAWNAGWGLGIGEGQTLVSLNCNDWFANGLGAVTGGQTSDSDFALDPGFCDVDSADVSLYSDSPLLTRFQCTQIGARGIGCSPPTLKALNVSSNQAGLELAWQFDAIHPIESWIERADQEGGRWDSLGTGNSTGSNSFGLLDRVVAPGHAYDYRVAWKDRGTLVRGSPVSGSWTDAGSLSSVSPNPAIGEINVDWVLSRPGVTDIRVYDLAGREIAVVARGSFNVGRHQARWDGQWAGRGVAPAGMYIVRITTSERTTSHRILLIR